MMLGNCSNHLSYCLQEKIQKLIERLNENHKTSEKTVDSTDSENFIPNKIAAVTSNHGHYRKILG